VPCEITGMASAYLGSRAGYERFSNIDSELPVSLVELIAVSVFTALTSPPSPFKNGRNVASGVSQTVTRQLCAESRVQN